MCPSRSAGQIFTIPGYKESTTMIGDGGFMSQVKAVPDGYHSIQPYLHIRGAAEAIDFYKKAFDATERMRMPQGDGRIGHAEIQIGDSVFMLADEFPEKDIYSPKHF